MQKPNALKRQKIIDTAARLFATRPFHEVRLEDVAAAAHVGKGTVYIYFKNKEELYLSLIRDSFARLIEELKAEIAHESSPSETLTRMVRRLVAFAFAHPEYFELLRSAREEQRRSLQSLRRQLTDLFADTLRRGIRQHLWHDPQPQLTAVCVPGMVRSAVVFGPREMGEEAIAAHIFRLLTFGFCTRESR